MGLIGDLSEKSVIDIACGEGLLQGYCANAGRRRSRSRSARGTIVLARANEAQDEPGTEYVLGGGRALELGTEYGLAVAAYPLNYAQEPRGAGADVSGDRALPASGRALRYRYANPALDFPAAPSFRKLNSTPPSSGRFAKGRLSHGPSFWETDHLRSRITFSMFDVMREVLRAAGFRKVHGIAPALA